MKVGLVAALSGYALGAAVMVTAIKGSTSSTAAIGFLFVPFYALVPAVPCFVFGLCSGYFLQARREPKRWRFATWFSLGVAVFLLVAGGTFLFEKLRLVRQVGQCLQMDGPRLNRYFRSLPEPHNKFILGAIAQNPRADASLLDTISLSSDLDLHRKMGSVFSVFGDGPAVMRLVARHPNVMVESLVRLAASEDDYVLGDVVMNPKTPLEILRQAHEKGGYLIEWGLAQNPNCPADILSSLAESSDKYTRSGVARNPGTPLEIVRQLARDPIWHVQRDAEGELSRR